MVFLRSLDLFLTNSLNKIIPHGLILDYFFSFFSLRGNSVFIWLIVLLFLIIFEEWRDHWFIIFFVLAFASTAILVNYGLKNIIKRSRPQITINMQKNFITDTTCPKDFSFPSGHAATAFAAAAILSGFDKKRKYFYYFLALLIAWSRIYLGCHFFLDISFGAIIGYFIGKSFYQLHRLLLHR